MPEAFSILVSIYFLPRLPMAQVLLECGFPQVVQHELRAAPAPPVTCAVGLNETGKQPVPWNFPAQGASVLLGGLRPPRLRVTWPERVTTNLPGGLPELGPSRGRPPPQPA